jgi:hypothetical protein
MAISKNGTYYLGRVVKIHNLDLAKFLDALRQPVVVTCGKYSWTITDFKEWNTDQHNFVFGRLTKFLPEGQVDIVDTERKLEVTQVEQNLKIASSPFVYLPAYSGIAYLHVWNEIEPDTFVKRFTSLITEKYNNFWLGCEIDPITDLVSFYKSVAQLDRINQISAMVKPPNPLFGHLWKDLKEYLAKRKAEEIRLSERATGNDGLRTDIKVIINTVISGNSEKLISTQPDITDAAILMAADGYGKGRIEGITNDKTVILRTRDTNKSINFEKDPDPIALYNAVEIVFREINEERHMEH